MISTYAKAAAAPRLKGAPVLLTAAEQRLVTLASRAKLARIEGANLPYKMRLNALLAADNRKGKLWA